MSDKNVTITFLPAGKKIDVPAGTTFLKAAVEAGIEVDAVCGGKGSCGRCRARIIEGALSEAAGSEGEHLTPEELKNGWVLLCQRKAQGDAVLETVPGSVAPDSQGPSKGKLMEADLEVSPLVAKVYHQLARPTIKDQAADLDRLLKQLPRGIKAGIKMVTRVPALLREAGYCVTSVVLDDELIALEKGDTVSEMYGIAFDVGTTSVAGYMVDLAAGEVVASISAANRQRSHGADVVSRITYTMEDDNGLAELQRLIAETIDDITGRLLSLAGVSPELIYALTLIGNTVMSHLLLGVSPAGVALAPFVPAFSRSLKGTAADLGLKSLPSGARFILLPNVAGYVGSDTVGVVLATKIYNLPGTWLAVDIGTNGEIVLSSGGRLLTCSTAAGPAFEGASISHGMRAEQGAIYQVRIENDAEIAVIGDTVPAGICGSGLIDAVSEMIRIGIVKGNGRIKSPEDLPPGFPAAVAKRIRQDGNSYKFVLAEGEREVAITQDDINKLQLGKGAVRAGIEILLNELGLKPSDLDGILLAGAFGSNLQPASLKGIGMLPGVDLGRVKPVGNAAGTGAVLALLSRRQLEIALALPERIEHVELSLHSGFQRAFARGLSFEVKKIMSHEQKKAGGSRERVSLAIQHRETDRIPKGELSIDEAVVKNTLSCEKVGFDETLEFVKKLELDIISINPVYPEFNKNLPDPGEVVWPNLDNWVNTGLFSFAVLDGVLGWGIKLFGFNRFLTLPNKSPLTFQSCAEKVASFNIKTARILIDAGIDGLVIADDLAYQRGLLMNPRVLRKYIFPSLKTQVAEMSRGAFPVFFHSDGNINEVVPDIIETGFTGLHCIDQGSSMDIFELRLRYGSKLCLWGGLSAEHLIAACDPGFLQYLMGRITAAAAKKGFILGTNSGLFKGIDMEGIFLIFEKLKEELKQEVKIF